MFIQIFHSDSNCAFQPVKERPKRKGPLDALPSSIEQWAEYDAPDEVLEAFKTEQMKGIGINAETIPKPVSTPYLC